MTFIFFTVKLIFKLLEVLFLSSFKFLFAPPLAFKLGLTFFQTFLTTSVGGILGVLFFYYLSEGLIILWRKYFSTIASWFISHPNRRNFPYLHLGSLRRNKKKVFTFRNRTLAKIRTNYGLLGIIILTPVVLSIPLGSFLAARYYYSLKTLCFLGISVFVWSIILSSVLVFF